MNKSVFLGVSGILTAFLLGYSANAATIAPTTVNFPGVGGLILFGTGLAGLIAYRRAQRMK